MSKNKIKSSDEAWETGELGGDEASIQVANVDYAAIDKSLGLVQISIRFQQSLIDRFKAIGEVQGIGYQPLMRQVLTNYVTEFEQKPQRHKARVKAVSAKSPVRAGYRLASRKRPEPARPPKSIRRRDEVRLLMRASSTKDE